jgi:hypothetical protein
MTPIRAETPSTHDVFLSYRHADRTAALELRDLLVARKLRVWFDEDAIPPGDLFQSRMAEGLKQSDAIAILIGPHSVAGWQEAEMQVALNFQRSSGTRVIPVLLPQVSPEQIPPFLQVHSSVNFQERINEPRALDRLYWGITLRKPGETPAPIPRKAVDEGPADDVTEALERLAGEFNKRPVTLFLGTHLSAGGQGTPRSCDIATRLLENITLLPERRGALRSTDQVMRRFAGLNVVPVAEILELASELEYVERPSPVLLPPLDVAAMYFEVKRDEVELEDQFRTFTEAAGVPATHGKAVALIERLIAKAPLHQTRLKQLIVTTSVDLFLERALAEGGLAFTQVVQHWSEAKVSVTEFSRPPARMTAGGVADWLRDQTEQDSREVEPRDLAAEKLAAPILYKFCGSIDHPGTCAISSGRLAALARNATKGIPEVVTSILRNTPLLILGARAFDPDYRTCLDSLLGGALKTGHKRYLVASRPGADETDCYLQMEMPLWKDIRNKARENGVALVEADAGEFLDRLLGMA